MAMRDPTRLRARRARADGALLKEIAAECGVSIATVSRWCAGLAWPDASRHGASSGQLARMRGRRWADDGATQARLRAEASATGVERVGTLTDRERDLLAVTAYWSEGSKSKPWRRSERLVFTNSDPGLVLVWVAFLRRHGVPDEDLRLHLSIHESADVAVATAHWSTTIGIPAQSFGAPWLKRAVPSTSRHNVGDGYVGCLVVRVVQSRQLYRYVDAMWTAVAQDAQRPRSVLADSTCTPSAVG